ncbi:MAG: signal peptidase I [Bryobacteraceae bacterium]|nr:signal peptidase I [Bryobacteraceae bacterium]
MARAGKGSSKSSVKRHWAADWSVQVLILLFGVTTVAQPMVVPTGSMENKILIGDHVIVDKLAYSPHGPISKHLLPYQDVRRGDIIVFRYPRNIRENYVKRVIGVPGDRIRLVNKQLWLNGRPVHEPYVIHKSPDIDNYRDNFPPGGELLVPPGMYFALGDNRDESLDSRYWGFVPRENIIGKPVLVWWSYDAPTERLATSNISLDHVADIALHFFTKTRWDRTMRLVRSYPLN